MAIGRKSIATLLAIGVICRENATSTLVKWLTCVTSDTMYVQPGLSTKYGHDFHNLETPASWRFFNPPPLSWPWVASHHYKINFTSVHSIYPSMSLRLCSQMSTAWGVLKFLWRFPHIYLIQQCGVLGNKRIASSYIWLCLSETQVPYHKYYMASLSWAKVFHQTSDK